MWFHPRKSPSNCHFEIKIDKDLIADTKTTFDELILTDTLTTDLENNIVSISKKIILDIPLPNTFEIFCITKAIKKY